MLVLSTRLFNRNCQLTSTMIGDSVLPGDICSGTWSVVLTDDEWMYLFFDCPRWSRTYRQLTYNNQTTFTR